VAQAQRLFGTNGIREVVGETLTAPFVVRVVRSIGAVIPPRSKVVVGRDGRTSSIALAQLASATLALSGHSVVELGLLPTPAIQYSVPRLGARLGVILTASHNPPEFNGIKCIAADGLEVERDVEQAIERGFADDVGTTVGFADVGSVSTDRLAGERYLEGILREVDPARIAERRFTVALDCANGTSVATSPELLRRLGCRTVTLNGQVDGTFPGRPSEPTERNVAELCRLVPSVGADVGVAHDGDADRAAFVNADGRYVPGEQVLTLLARDAVERHGGGVVVTPVTGSQALEEAIAPLGGSVVYTRVGSPAVTREMQRQKAVFGGEENGGLVRPTFQLARDGAMTLAGLLDLLARTRSTLTELLASIPRYSMVKESVPCPTAAREKVLEHLRTSLGAAGGKVVTIDGLKVYRDGGWYLLRPSGTEPIFRVFAEAREPGDARSLANRGIAAVKDAVAAVGAG
jgi:phosphomannomutase/phosphoglucomutase